MITEETIEKIKSRFWIRTGKEIIMNNDVAAILLEEAFSEFSSPYEKVGEAGSMPGTAGFTMAAFRATVVPCDTPLYMKVKP